MALHALKITKLQYKPYSTQALHAHTYNIKCYHSNYKSQWQIIISSDDTINHHLSSEHGETTSLYKGQIRNIYPINGVNIKSKKNQVISL